MKKKYKRPHIKRKKVIVQFISPSEKYTDLLAINGCFGRCLFGGSGGAI